jgi:quercetin dioxygenase-like cupin family protein
MKKIALVIILPLTLSLVAIAAQKKEGVGSSKSAATEQHVALNLGDVQWGDAPPVLPAGAKFAVIQGDPGKKGVYTIRLKVPSGYRIPPHFHPTTENVSVISGTMSFGMGDKFDEAAGKEIQAGGFASMPAGMKHFAWATGETVIQVHGMGPFQITYVNPADDPRNAKK